MFRTMLGIGLLVCATTAFAGEKETNKDNPGQGNPDGVHQRKDTGKPGGAQTIQYHGGPVMLGTVNAYAIYYGNWSGSSMAILNNLLSHIGGTPYFNINTTYYDGQNRHVSGAVSLAGAYLTGAYLGNSLSDLQIQQIVSDAISANHLPKDSNGVYFVLTWSDVTAKSGFCTQYCGWHTHGTISGSDIKYAFIGNPARCPSACTNGTKSPNNDVGADGAASIIAHELEEAVTDPDLNAWFDRQGAENADKCAWTFGTTYTTANGGVANMNIGGMDFLIQRNWLNAGTGSCAQQYP